MAVLISGYIFAVGGKIVVVSLSLADRGGDLWPLDSSQIPLRLRDPACERQMPIREKYYCEVDATALKGT